MVTTTIPELAAIPEPGIIEKLSFDAVFAAIVQDFQGRYPDFTALLESDPAVKLLEVAAYRELLLRNRINEAARGQMLAFAAGTDLDHLGVFYGVERLEGESDIALRRRIRQRIMGFSNAGGADTYRYWALTASSEIADVAVTSPQPGHVHVSVLSRLGDGTASEEFLKAVRAVVLQDDVRVLTDTVHVLGAEIVPVNVAANIWLLPDSVAELLDVLPSYLASEFAGAAIATAAVLIYKYWEPLGAFFSGLFEGIGQDFAAFEPVGDVFNAIADAVKGVWEWISQLFDPVKLTSDKFAALSESGKAVGEVIGSVLAGAVKVVLLPLETLISGLKWLKGLVFGDETSANQPSDAVPQPVSGRTTSITTTNQPAVYITVPPGTDAQGVADAARREVERAMASGQDMGWMYD